MLPIPRRVLLALTSGCWCSCEHLINFYKLSRSFCLLMMHAVTAIAASESSFDLIPVPRVGSVEAGLL